MAAREYVVPRVSVVVDTTKLIAPTIGVPNIVIIVGTAQWGPMGVVTELSTLSSARSYFQGDVTTGTDVTLPKCFQLLFGNGATDVKVLRVQSASVPAAKAAATFNNGATQVLTFTGLYYGEHGNNITVTITTNGSGRDVTVTDGLITEQVIGAADNDAIVSGLANSQLVVVTKLNSSLVDATSVTSLTGGLNGASTANSDYSSALTSLETVTGDIVVLAGQTSTTLQAALNTHCQSMATNNKPRIGICGSALSESVATAISNATSLASDRMVYCYPGIKMIAEDGTEETISGGYGAAAIAGMIASRDVNVSITNQNVLGITGLETELSSSDIRTLILGYVMPLAPGILGGYTPIKDITTSTTSPFNILTTRRIVDYTINNVLAIGSQFIGRLNTDSVRGALKGVLTSFLTVSTRNTIFVPDAEGGLPNGFSVDVHASRADQIAGICNVDLRLVPVMSVYYIDVNIVLQ